MQTTGLYVIIENKSGGDCTLDNIVVSVGGTPITNSVGSSNDRELTKSTLTFHAAVLEVTEDPVRLHNTYIVAESFLKHAS